MCDRYDLFVNVAGNLGTDPNDSDPAFHDADPHQGQPVTVYFIAKTRDETQAIVRQGSSNVGDFYTNEIGPTGAHSFVSNGEKILYEVTRCEDGQWKPYKTWISAPVQKGNIKTSLMESPIARLVFVTGKLLD